MTTEKMNYFFDTLDQHLAAGVPLLSDAVMAAFDDYACKFHANTPPAGATPATRSGGGASKKSAGLTFTPDEANPTALDNMTDRDMRTVTASEYAGWQAAFDHANARIAELVQENASLKAAQSQFVTVWKDGAWKVWSATDAHHAEQDAAWLVTIPLARARLALAGDAKEASDAA